MLQSPAELNEGSWTQSLPPKTCLSSWRRKPGACCTATLRGSHELLCAGPDGALRYSEAFAWSRHLPASGALANGHIERIMLGWSESDQAWHLGLLLTPQLAALRDSRWCELASWPDPDQSDFLELAERAGQSLAALTERPFQLIAPQAPAPQTREPLFEEAPPPPERPLPHLPLGLQRYLVA